MIIKIEGKEKQNGPPRADLAFLTFVRSPTAQARKNKFSILVPWALLCKNLSMFDKDLKEKYQFLTDYFEMGFKNPDRSIAHSILFYGQDIQAQYKLATEIARLLNCKESQKEDCHCINCNWVNERQHPAVLTVSKIDSKPSDDETKNVISIAQSRMIKNSLLNTSDYHRVFIFCDAEIKEGVWTPAGLNMFNLQEAAINALLKSIEEPPANTTFFFLTRDKNDLIETIISRSQSFFVPSYDTGTSDFSVIETFLEDYPQIERKESLDLAQSLFTLSKEHGSEKVLTQIQNFLLSLLKSNIENDDLKYKVLADVKSVELAKNEIGKHITPLLAFEDLCLNMTKSN